MCNFDITGRQCALEIFTYNQTYEIIEVINWNYSELQAPYDCLPGKQCMGKNSDTRTKYTTEVRPVEKHRNLSIRP